MMRKFEDLTVDQEMIIFKTLEKHRLTPMEAARYVKNITETCRKLRLNVFALWTIRCRHISIEISAMIKSFTR